MGSRARSGAIVYQSLAMELQRALRPVLRLPFRVKPTISQSSQRTFTSSAVLQDSPNSPKSQDDKPIPNPESIDSSSKSATSRLQGILDFAAPSTSNEASSSSSSSPPSSTDSTQPSQLNIRRQASAPSMLGNLIGSLKPRTSADTAAGLAAAASQQNRAGTAAYRQEEQPWHLHVYAHKHNTHLTLTRPDRQPVISISAGNIGFRKAQRGGFDAAYQLGAYLMARIQRAGLLRDMHQLELVFRGFGNGREAMVKIITGTEGAALRNVVCRVTDATRLKFGGTRSKAPRRLG